MDLQGHDITEAAEQLNDLFLGPICQPLRDIYRGHYPTMGNAQVFIAKITWDYHWYWAVVCLLFFQDRLSDPAFMGSLGDELDRYLQLNAQMQQRFDTWGRLDAGARYQGGYADQDRMPWLTELHNQLDDALQPDELRDRIRRNLGGLAALAEGLVALARRHGHVLAPPSSGIEARLPDAPLGLEQIHLHRLSPPAALQRPPSALAGA